MIIFEYFKEIEDPRVIQKNVKHPFNEILFLVFCAMIADCDGWEEIAEWGEARIDMLRKHLPYQEGVASADTLRRVLSMLDPKKLEAAFNEMMADLQPNRSQHSQEDLEDAKAPQIAIDGKRVRGAKTKNSILHIISGYATETGMIIAQYAETKEGKEIPQIKALLDILNIEKQLITIDGVASHKAMTEIITEKKGDYILPIKGNQRKFKQAIQNLFESEGKIESNYFEEKSTKSHGRIEKRICRVIDDLSSLEEQLKGWSNINAIIEITRIRTLKDETIKTKTYHITSLKKPKAKDALSYIRSHWHTENKQHYKLDVVFREDKNLTKAAANNLAIIRRAALNKLTEYQQTLPKHKAISRIRFWAILNADNIQKILSC